MDGEEEGGEIDETEVFFFFEVRKNVLHSVSIRHRCRNVFPSTLFDEW